MSGRPREASGPFRSHMIRDGDPYELRDGHAIRCMTAGERHGHAQSQGARTLASDPQVRDAVGIGVGISFNDDKNLRAPDLVVGTVGASSGWMRTPPPLAVEYADGGQDEAGLRDKIAELLGFGTRLIWVVRLTGPLRVEVHAAGEPVRVVDGDGVLTAPGILQNSVPVRALVDPKASREATLRNLLSAAGYESIDEIRAEAEVQTQVRAIRAIFALRGLAVSEAAQARLAACRDPERLARWHLQSVTAATAEAALD